MTVRGAALVGLLVAISGCLAPGDETTDGDTDVPRVAASLLAGLLADVPCDASSVTATATSDNLLRVANASYEQGDHAELDIKGDLAVHSTHGASGFELLNVSDPLASVILSSFTGDLGTSLDVKLHPDLTTVFQGVGAGVEIVDIRDRSLPTKTGEWLFPMPNPITNAHMIYVYALDNETTLLFIAPEDFTGVHILKVTGEPGAYGLETLASAGAGLNGPLGPHDMWATFDEKLGKHVLYIANGFMGWLAYDITAPASPELLGGSPNPDTHQGYTHTIQAQWIGERRLVATISEVGVNAMRVFDATDLGMPVLLGSWQYDVPALLQHNLQLVNGTLFFSHYGQGVFAFDLTAVGDMPYGELLQLTPVAHFAVERSSWDVNVKDGLLYIGDSDQLHVVGYGCWTAGDPALTSTG